MARHVKKLLLLDLKGEKKEELIILIDHKEKVEYFFSIYEQDTWY